MKKSVLIALILLILVILALLFTFLRGEKRGDFFRFLAATPTQAGMENFTFDDGQ